MKKYLLSSLFIITFLGGCTNSQPNVKDLLKEMEEQSEKIDSLAMDFIVNADCDLIIKENDTSSKNNIKNDLVMELELNKESVHLKLENQVKFLGMNDTTINEVYTVKEDGELVSYRMNENSSLWTKKSEEIEKNESLKALLQEIINSIENIDKKYVRIKGVEEINNKECYELEIKVNKKYYESILLQDEKLPLDGTNDLVKMLGDDFELEIDIYIDKEEKTIQKISTDMKDIIEPLLKESLFDVNTMGNVELDINDAEVNIEFSDYNQVKEIIVPEQIKSSAIDFVD